MKNIRYRAWWLKCLNEGMHEVDELNHIFSWKENGMIGVNGIGKSIGIVGGKHKDCILMQSTWLRDKNDIEIFEDDIVKYPDWKLRLIEWKRKYGCFSISYDIISGHLDLDKVEIVGNKHENPKFLKQCVAE